MPQPAKTNADAILGAARRHLEQHGRAALSLRAVAAELGVAPNALYWHFRDRDALLAALADEGVRQLLAALQHAAEGHEGTQRVERMALAYLDFARAQPELYQVTMTKHPSPAQHPPAHMALWTFVVDLLTPVVGAVEAPKAGVTLWAYLHGLAGLERADVYHDDKQPVEVTYGLTAFLSGLQQAKRKRSSRN